MTPPRSCDHFTTAILCACLPEADAIEALFDTYYDTDGCLYGKQPGYINIYFHGQISNHNAVVCYLPDEDTSSIRNTVHGLRMSYVNITLVLLIGTCSGTPISHKQYQIFLGDVIISDCLIEDNMRMAKEKKQKVPLKEYILEILYHLKTDQAKILSRTLSAHLKEVQKSDKRWNSPSGHDVLFDASYSHGQSKCLCTYKNAVVTGTNHIKRLRCYTETPSVHIGALASVGGSRISGLDRDILARDYNAIGFQSSGAGIWDGFSTFLIIKGVRDYADSHNYEKWEDYAAAAGASAAKAILEYFTCTPPSGNDNNFIIPFPRNVNFVGRQHEIEELESMITLPSQYGINNIGITGLVGIGKSQLASELAYRIRERDSRYLILWISCTSAETVNQSFTAIARGLGLVDTAPERVKRVLEGSTKELLLILDGLDNWSVWEPLTSLLPRQGCGHRLITTRDQRIATKITSRHFIVLDGLDEESATSLLCNKLYSSVMFKESGMVAALLKKLAYLPLAISHAVDSLNQNQDMTILDYTSNLAKADSDTTKYLSSVFTDLFNQLSKSNAFAARYLKLMACVDSQAIPMTFLPLHDTAFETLNAQGFLRSFHFLQGCPKDSIQLNPLVRLAARAWMSDNNDFELHIQQAVRRLEAIFFDSSDGNVQLWEDYLSHAVFILSEAKTMIHIGPDYSDFPWKIVHCLWAAGRFREAQELSSTFMFLRREKYGSQDQSTLTYMAWLAYIYSETWQWDKAKELESLVLEARRNTLGTQHNDTIRSIMHLARIYSAEGNWSSAEKLYLELIDIGKLRKQGGDTTILECLTEIATALRRFERKKEELTLRQYIFQAYASMWKKDISAIRASKHAMAIANYAFSPTRAHMAKQLFLEIIKEQETVIPKNKLATVRPDYLIALASLECLASTHAEGNEWEQARWWQEKACDLYRELLGRRHSYTLNAFLNLARIYQQQGQWSEARDILSEIVEISKQMPLLEFPIRQIMFNLSSIYAKLCQHNTADIIKKQAMQTNASNYVPGPTYSYVMDRLDSLRCAETIKGVETSKLMARVGQLVAQNPYFLRDDSGQVAADMLVKWQNPNQRRLSLKSIIYKVRNLAKRN